MGHRGEDSERDVVGLRHGLERRRRGLLRDTVAAAAGFILPSIAAIVLFVYWG